MQVTIYYSARGAYCPRSEAAAADTYWYCARAIMDALREGADVVFCQHDVNTQDT